MFKMKRFVYVLLFLTVGNIGIASAQATIRGGSSSSDTTSSRPRMSSNVTDEALLNITSKLYSLDVNGAYGILDLDLQGKTNSGSSNDKAPQPLFKSPLPAELLERPTYSTLLALFDNYEAAVNITEVVTPQELAEESAFLDAILNTAVMQEAHRFLVSEKLLKDARKGQFKDLLRSMWFGLYQRSPGKQGSSGFEHIFLGEWKNGISGLHSWIRFQQEESKGKMNYLGFIKTIPIGRNSVGLIEMPMEWQGIYKPFNTVSIGPSPELDIALYTICFLARPEAFCPVQGPAGNGRNSRTTRYRIQSFVSTFRGTKFIGSAYPAF